MDHGKLRPPEIISRISTQDPKGKPYSLSSYNHNLTPQLYKGSTVLSQALYKLVASSYLKPSTVPSHISPRDKRIKYEAEEKAKILGFPTAKELRHAKEVADARLKREKNEAEKVGLVSKIDKFWFVYGNEHVLQKRKAPHLPGSRALKVSIFVSRFIVSFY